MINVFENASTDGVGYDRWCDIKWPKGRRLQLEAQTKASRAYLDTFDWRLYKAGMTLYRQGGTLYPSGNSIRHEPIRTKAPKSFFCWDLEVGALRDHLDPIIEMRALYPQLTLNVMVERYSLLDNLDKTVARIRIERFGDDHEGCRIEVTPILGYEGSFEKVTTRLIGAGFSKVETPILPSLLAAQSIDPYAYQAKPKINLKPQMSGGLASRAVLKHLLKVMDANLDGMKQDVDSEFLHDYRVAIRRIRSAAAWIGFCVDLETLTRLKQDFSLLGAATGPTRDIDVYLLKEDEYRNLLPPEDREAITPFFQWLEKRRVSERRKMLAAINSPANKENIAFWSAFSAEKDAGGEPILPLAKQMIYKRYRKILKRGGRINEDSPDQMLHDLRIDCKKLRYLLETFTSLFDAAEMKVLVKALKGLQEILGDFNDLFVQQCRMKDYAEVVDRDSGRDTLLACGYLISCLYRTQRQVRTHFAERFEIFSNQTHRDQFKRMFGEGEASA